MICVYVYLKTKYYNRIYPHPKKRVILKFRPEELPLTDLFSYTEWLNFLSRYRNENNQYLPRTDKNSGEKIVYRVASIGGKEKIRQFFPVDKKGNKLFLAKYGELLPIKDAIQ